MVGYGYCSAENVVKWLYELKATVKKIEVSEIKLNS